MTATAHPFPDVKVYWASVRTGPYTTVRRIQADEHGAGESQAEPDEEGVGQRAGERGAVGKAPWAMGTAGGSSRQTLAGAEAAQRRKTGAPALPLPPDDGAQPASDPTNTLSPGLPRTRRRPPEARLTAFTAHPPDLPPRPLMAMDFAALCSLVRPGRPRIRFLSIRVAALLHASLRPRLATTPLRFANPSPPSGWIENLHLQAVSHARHTKKGGPKPSFPYRAPRAHGTHCYIDIE